MYIYFLYLQIPALFIDIFSVPGVMLYAFVAVWLCMVLALHAQQLYGKRATNDIRSILFMNYVIDVFVANIRSNAL